MKNKKAKNAWEYFDDCLVCQVMEKAENEGRSLGQEELETAFAKQNLKNKLEQKNRK